LLIDLSVPRNIDPQLSTHPLISLFNIDQLNKQLQSRKDALEKSLNQAEDMLIEAVDNQIHLFKEKEKNRLKILIASSA